jgi:uncharacterized repeat protein (TIGR02543 family)
MCKIVRKRAKGVLAGVGVVVALAIIILSLQPSAPAFAIPQPGHYFYGDVTIAAEPVPKQVPEGTVITGTIVGTSLVYTSTVDNQGRYGYQEPYMVVSGDDPGTPEKEGGAKGDSIGFYVGGVRAECQEPGDVTWEDTYLFSSGKTTNLDLRVPVYTLTITSTGCCPISIEYTPSVGGNGVITGTVAAGESEDFTDISRDTVVTATAESDVCCAFDSWVIDGGTPITDTNPITVTMDSDHTAEAKCSVPTYTLTVDVSPEGVGEVEVDGVAPPAYPMTYTHDCCTYVTLNANPTDECYEFVGWTGDVITTTNPITIHMDASKVITATFQKIKYDLTINKVGEGTVTQDPLPVEGKYDCSTDVTLTASPAACYEFVGWTGDVITITNPITIHMDASKVITATFQKIQYDLTINKVGEGTVMQDPLPVEGKYECSTDVTLTASPAACYKFVGWTGDVITTTNPITIHMDASKVITATFQKIQYDLTVNKVGEGTVTQDPLPVEGKYDCSTDVTLTASPAACYEFVGWTGDVITTTNPITIHMDASKVITATFQKIQYDLTINKVGEGTVTQDPLPVEGKYECCTDVTLTADPDACYEFMGWTGDVITTTNPITIHMDASKVITATFSIKRFIAPLGADWNLLSTPIRLDAAHETLAQIFPPETLANLLVAYGWDAANEIWVGPLSGVYQLLPLDAIFVKLAASGTAVFVPSEELTSLPSRDLVAGLNLIGPAPAFNGVEFPAMPLDQALVSIEYAPGGLRGYIMVISPALNQPGWTYALGGTIQDLLAYKGYWVVMENPDTLYGFSTTPIG